MSFNYVEIQETIHIAQAELFSNTQQPLKVESIEFVDFPLPPKLSSYHSDINLAFNFQGKRLVFSLKAPWVGFFLEDAIKFRKSNLTWTKAFDQAKCWIPEVSGSSLIAISCQPGERIVQVQFNIKGEKRTLEFHLFGSRPNWIYFSEDEEISHWRTSKLTPSHSPPTSNENVASSYQPHTVIPQTQIYDEYLKQRQEDLLAQIWSNTQNKLQEKLIKEMKSKADLDGIYQRSLKSNAILEEAQTLKATLHLHPDQSEKVQKMFEKYKKLNRTQKEVQTRLEVVQSNISKLKTLVQSFRQSFQNPSNPTKQLKAPQDFTERYKKLTVFLKENNLLPKGYVEKDSSDNRNINKNEKKWIQSKSKNNMRSFHSKEGLSIWIGKTHKENEELVIRLAKGNDIWLHTKGRPGAHAIIRLNKGKTASLETLLDAATLVAYFSGAPKSSKAEVDYTFRKNVKRIPQKSKSEQGQFLVSYTQNKTLSITIDSTRLDRLFATEQSE